MIIRRRSKRVPARELVAFETPRDPAGRGSPLAITPSPASKMVPVTRMEFGQRLVDLQAWGTGGSNACARPPGTGRTGSSVDTMIMAGIADDRADAIRLVLPRFREQPEYEQLREQVREIDRLRAGPSTTAALQAGKRQVVTAQSGCSVGSAGIRGWHAQCPGVPLHRQRALEDPFKPFRRKRLRDPPLERRSLCLYPPRSETKGQAGACAGPDAGHPHCTVQAAAGQLWCYDDHKGTCARGVVGGLPWRRGLPGFILGSVTGKGS